VFYKDDTELFRGMFISQSQSQNKAMTAKAYDNGIRLANNKDTFNYTNATATEIFSDICQRFGIPKGNAVDTKYKIPELPKPKTTAWDCLADALTLTREATGVRYYPRCSGEKLELIERRESILMWVIETGVNLIDYSQTKSIEKIKTRIKLLSKEGGVLAEASDAALEGKIGVFSDIADKKDEMTNAQLKELVNTTLAENNKSVSSLSVSALGQPDVITGSGVSVIIKHLGISRTYYVEEDTHTFSGGLHTMRLKLATALDSKGGGE
jgi:hypothetical protein